MFPFVLSITIPVSCTLCRDCSFTFVSKYSDCFTNLLARLTSHYVGIAVTYLCQNIQTVFCFGQCISILGPSLLSSIKGKYITTPKKDSCLNYFCNIAKNCTYIHIDATMASQYITNLKEDTKLTSALLAKSPNSAWNLHGSLYTCSHL